MSYKIKLYRKIRTRNYVTKKIIRKKICIKLILIGINNCIGNDFYKQFSMIRERDFHWIEINERRVTCISKCFAINAHNVDPSLTMHNKENPSSFGNRNRSLK